MDVDEFEDYLELQDPKMKKDIEMSNREYLEGESRPSVTHPLLGVDGNATNPKTSEKDTGAFTPVGVAA
jgi:hypothetical protein